MLVYIPPLSLMKMVAYCRWFSGMFPPPSVPQICPRESCLWQEVISCGGLLSPPDRGHTAAQERFSRRAQPPPTTCCSRSGLQCCSDHPSARPGAVPTGFGPLFMGTPFCCCSGRSGWPGSPLALLLTGCVTWVGLLPPLGLSFPTCEESGQNA